MQDSRNADVLQHIILYCNDIADTIERFGDDYEVFAKDSAYRNATALCVLQIGERGYPLSSTCDIMQEKASIIMEDLYN